MCNYLPKQRDFRAVDKVRRHKMFFLSTSTHKGILSKRTACRFVSHKMKLSKKLQGFQNHRTQSLELVEEATSAHLLEGRQTEGTGPTKFQKHASSHEMKKKTTLKNFFCLHQLKIEQN